jgi:predicted RNase H-like nuclease (RuvC/YqgF family)
LSNIKIKIAIVCAVAVAALVMLFSQQQTVKDLRQQNEALKQQVTQVAPLQEQLASATQSAAAGAAVQEEQTRELARLRNEVSQLRRHTNELAQARQEIQTLNQRVASEAEARRGAVASLQAETQKRQIIAQSTQNMNACINNLRLIDSAKQQWALENKKQATDMPTVDDLRPYLAQKPNGLLLACPDGGIYTIGAVGEKPTCSIPGHVLP